jgi:PAS domain S-box-containing protein
MRKAMKGPKSLRILLVEDNEHDRLAFQRALRKSQASCAITECVRAEEAIKRLRTNTASFNIVVVDHNLPGMTGLDLCRELLEEGMPLPLVLLTGRGSEELAVSALKAGVDDYVVKDSRGGYLDLLPVVLPQAVAKHEDRVARKRAEEALRESEERFRNIVEGSQAGYCFIDKDGCFQDCNDAWLRMHGYASRDEVMGQHFTLTQADANIDQGKRNLERLLNGEPIPSGESISRCKDGCIAYHTFSANPVVTRGEVVGAELFFIDISEQKQAEEELRRINEELKSFSHIVSHDLKTPIVFIQGFASLLLEGYEDKLDEKGRTCLERIRANANRMEALISDLLALSRIGRVVSTFEKVSYSEIVHTVLSNLQDRLNETEVEVMLEDHFPTIYCDGERIYQVLDNLIVNAIKFRDPARSPKIQIGHEDKGAFHQFFVRDNGIGIDAKHHVRIFERFHRLRQTKDVEGTGLGLSIVERIVNNHGGRIWVESECGVGSTFYFTIPSNK